MTCLLFITIAVQFVPPPLLLEGGVNRVDGAAVALEETAAAKIHHGDSRHRTGS